MEESKEELGKVLILIHVSKIRDVGANGLMFAFH